MRRPWLFLIVICACSREDTASSSAPATGERVEQVEEQVEQVESQPEQVVAESRFFMAEGAPDPQACKVAADCLGNTIPDRNNPCCQDPRTLEPYTRAYWAWIGTWRRDHCDEVTCPPPPAPSLPPDCAFEVDCVEGVCVDSCPPRRR
jgi:hypothetical protein